MLTYVYFGTNDLDRAIRFYNAILAPLGMSRCVTGDPVWDRVSAGWGIYEDNGVRELAFRIGKPFDNQAATTGNGSMVAFRARSWKEVDEFHAAALAPLVEDRIRGPEFDKLTDALTAQVFSSESDIHADVTLDAG